MSTKKYFVKIKKLPASFRVKNAKYSYSWELHPLIGRSLMDFLRIKGRNRLQKVGFFRTKKEAKEMLRKFFKENKAFRRFVKVIV